jgi:NAD(P)-dependent dehydrogenase (short-subunit alcohol dehydrogenase family)
MAQRALVIGGAGKVGRGVSRAFQEAGFEVLVVDPAGGGIAEPADPALAGRVGSVDVAVLSLPARGEGRESGHFRAAEAASAELPGRLAALELAVAALSGGPLVELAGGALLDPGAGEASLIGRWQRGIHAGLHQAGIAAVLCAITGYVDPDSGAREVGQRIVEIASGGRSGICCLEPAAGAVEWEG